MATRLVAIIISVALATGLAGCAGLARCAGLVGYTAEHPANPAVAGARRAPAPLDSQGLDLLTQSGSWAQSEYMLDLADDRFTQHCMQAKGFDYPAVPRDTDRADETSTINMAARQREGYGIVQQAPTTASDAPRTAVDTYVAGLRRDKQDRFRSALFGSAQDRVSVDLLDGAHVTIPGRGCAAESMRALAGDVIAWARFTYLPMQLNNQLADTLPAAPEFTAAMARWKSCMAGHGFPFSAPAEARAMVQTRLAAEGPTSTLQHDEIMIATADGSCALASHLPSVALQVRRTLARTLPADRRELLAWLRADRDAAVSRARIILSR